MVEEHGQIYFISMSVDQFIKFPQKSLYFRRHRLHYAIQILVTQHRRYLGSILLY